MNAKTTGRRLFSCVISTITKTFVNAAKRSQNSTDSSSSSNFTKRPLELRKKLRKDFLCIFWPDSPDAIWTPSQLPGVDRIIWLSEPLVVEVSCIIVKVSGIIWTQEPASGYPWVSPEPNSSGLLLTHLFGSFKSRCPVALPQLTASSVAGVHSFQWLTCCNS